MRELEDKRLCPHCGGQLHRLPYLMARRASQNVLPARMITLVVAFIAALTLLTLHAG